MHRHIPITPLPNVAMPNMAADGGVSLGTTIIAVTYDGGVILGADTRTSTGQYISNRTKDKIAPLSDRVYSCTSGSAADAQAVASYVQFYIAQGQAEAGEEMCTKTVAHLAAGISYGNKDKLAAGFIIGGWDKHEGGTVWAVTMGGSLMQAPYAMAGSGSSYIYGFCDKYWRANMTESEAHAFVQKALGLAMARDASSGGCIRTVTIDKDGARRTFLPGTELEITYGEMATPSVAARLAALQVA